MVGVFALRKFVNWWRAHVTYMWRRTLRLTVDSVMWMSLALLLSLLIWEYHPSLLDVLILSALVGLITAYRVYLDPRLKNLDRNLMVFFSIATTIWLLICEIVLLEKMM